MIGPQDSDSGPQLRILSVAVFGGFLDGLRLLLPATLTCVIGPRGAGKSTTLELIRYALGLMPDDSPAERRRIETLIDKNLDSGRVEVTIQTKEGLTYVVSRAGGEAPVVLTHDMRPTELSIESGVLFRAEVFSQNEVEAIADSPEAQRAILDGFATERLGCVEAEIRLVHESLDQNAGRIEAIEDRLTTLADEVSLLQDVEGKLKEYGAIGGAEQKKFAAATSEKASRDTEQRDVASAVTALGQLQGKVTALRQDLASRVGKKAGPSAGPNRALMDEFQRTVESLRSEIVRLLETADQKMADGRKSLEQIGSRLQQAHKEQDVAYRKFIESHEQLQAKSAERVLLEKRREDLLKKGAEHAECAQTKAEQLAEREELLSRLAALRDERFQIRDEVVARVNAELSPTIRVRMQQFGDRQKYREFVAEVLRGPGKLKHASVAQRLTDAIGPGELADVIRGREAKSLVKLGNVTPDQAEKVLNALSDRGALLKLEAIPLDDLTTIELKDGKEYKESGDISKGQKCTAILPILLLERDHPLLIDQPEDNLDNRFIYQTIVEGIRRVKGRRQLIFVTHNPNIPVLGDAENVVVLESDGRRARVVQQGSVDECQDKIVELLEGGEEAFKLRQTRYHY